MKVHELIAELQDMPLDAEVRMDIHCHQDTYQDGAPTIASVTMGEESNAGAVCLNDIAI